MQVLFYLAPLHPETQNNPDTPDSPYIDCGIWQAGF